jgi:hypothetical protein
MRFQNQIHEKNWSNQLNYFYNFIKIDIIIKTIKYIGIYGG